MATEATRRGAGGARPAVTASSSTRIDLTGRDAEPSLGQLVSSASKDLSGLVRAEVELAKAEIKDDVKHGIKGGALFGAAAVLGLLAVVLLSSAAAWAIAEVLPAWAGFLIVALVYLLIAGLCAYIGYRQVTKVKPPERTIASTKETVAVLKGGGSGTPAR